MQNLQDYAATGGDKTEKSGSAVDLNDQLILELFHKWSGVVAKIAAILRRGQAGEASEAHALIDAAVALTAAIAETPATGIAGLAVKLYLALHEERDEIYSDTCFIHYPTAEDGLAALIGKAALRDMERLVPKVAAIIGAGPLPNVDELVRTH